MIVNESVLSLGISLIALFFAGLLAAKVNQSLTAVFIVVGMILQNFFPVTIITEFIATLGIIFMLFMFGLEFSVGNLFHNQRKIFTTGIYDLFFNFPIGLLLGWILGYDLMQSLLLGGILYVTSSVIVAKSIIDLKRSANPETEYILNILIFEDMFIALFLAFFVGILNYGHIDTKGTIIVLLKTSAFFLFFIVLAKTSKKFIDKIVDIEHTELFVILILSIIVLSAGAASKIGLSEAIGAFLAGLLLSETKQRHRISEAIKPFQQFSTAIFFVAFGMSIDYKHVTNLIPIGIFIFVISSFSKVFGGYFIGKRYHLSRKAGLRLGFSLIPRGEFSIILAGTIAMNPNLPFPLKSLTGVYVLLSAILGSIIMKESDWFVKWFIERKEGETKQISDRSETSLPK
ncbi:MAG: cation:proton antiporter [Candidatus Brocadia sp. AMX2]|uniref:Kef-type K+ transport systems membrane components n=1 Tax=Candidatus Brocadia sinica JPN1 TaxID=1197129 RepID=A0ABQ0JZF1_9BACT|nr:MULTISPECIES: cation:proton antiporter [Brocadia]KXK30911.1 MAG: putative Na+/H+ antiporter [Candidatus Brocadia sinica]MBC6931227.1 cation:proton antiporter [Candidatus Brocadia sp.]MBL1168602.1 cation:proton antiporter [Candidatus Brocadia sp. AMX1]NOG40138.1 cation:proton antiporter [Planctomycetota bacterium]KAA0246072.1 MAG: cation:proton antiporter [Candidatus Brocadia sp. AMX2]